MAALEQITLRASQGTAARAGDAEVGTVVRKEEHQGLVRQSIVLERLHHLACAIIHRLHDFGESVGAFAVLAGHRILDRRVDGIEGDIEAEGFGLVPGDEIDRMINDQRGGVPLLFEAGGALPPVELVALEMGEVVDVAGKQADEFVEAPGRGIELGQVAQMPFAEDAGGVADTLQRVGEGVFLVRQTGGGVWHQHAVEATTLLISASH